MSNRRAGGPSRGAGRKRFLPSTEVGTFRGKEVTMRSTAFLLLCLAVAAAMAAPLPFPKPKPSVKTDAEALQGEWVAVREPGGPGAAGMAMTIAVKGDRISFFVGTEL